MKNKKLSFQLNRIHIALLAIVLIVIMIVNSLFLQGVAHHNTHDTLKLNTQLLNNSINNELNNVEVVADYLLNNMASENIVSEQIVEAIKLNPIIDKISIIELKGNELDWGIQVDSDSIIHLKYNRFINSSHLIQIVLTNDWLGYISSKTILDKPFEYNVFNDNFNIHVTPEKTSFTNKFDSDEILNEDIGKGKLFKGLKYAGMPGTYYSFVVLNEKINSFLSVSYNHSSIAKSFGRYPAFITLLFIAIFIVVSYLIYKANGKYTKPYSEILNIFESGKVIKSRKSASEPMQIRRNIEQLQNQINLLEKKLERTSIENKKIENDLKIAKKLQTNILPTDTKDIINRSEFKISAMSEAAFDVGGDLYDYYMLDDDHLLFVVGDISGKGIPAALFMIYTQTLLRTIAKPGMKVSDIIELLNNKLIEENITDLFVTMFLGVLEISNGTLNYCNAAHNAPIIVRQEGSIEELEITHGIPVGIYKDRKYKFSEIQLNTDDQILIYTDGLTDSIDENEMNYSVDVLKYNLMGTWFMSPKETLEKINNSVVDFRGNVDPVDDMTILIIQFKNEVNI